MRLTTAVFVVLVGLVGDGRAQVASPVAEPTVVSAAVGQTAVKDVLAQYTLNPLAKVAATGQALPEGGQWGYGKTRPAICPKDASVCVQVLYTVPESQVQCEWTVVPEHDGVQAKFLDENADAARYLLRKVGSAELAALVVTSPQPVYGAIARAAHVEGPVVVKVLVSDAGVVTAAAMVSGTALLRASTVDTAKMWTFRPLMVGSRAVPFVGDLTATYEIGKVANGTLPKGAVKMQP